MRLVGGKNHITKPLPMATSVRAFCCLFLCLCRLALCPECVYKALRDQLAAVLGELRRMEAGGGVDGELMEIINLIAKIMEGMKEDTNGR